MSPWGGSRPGDEITGKQPCWEFVLLSPWYLRDHIADWLSGSQSPYCSRHEPRTSMLDSPETAITESFSLQPQIKDWNQRGIKNFYPWIYSGWQIEYLNDQSFKMLYLLSWCPQVDLFFVAVSIVYQQESIPEGCIPPTCQSYVFWWLPLGVSGREMSIPEVGVGIPRGGGEHPWGIPSWAEYTRSGACTREWGVGTQPPPDMGPRILTRPLWTDTPVKTLPSRNESAVCERSLACRVESKY